MKNTYRIYTKWLAVALRREGFKIVGKDVNERVPELDVYIFEDSKELQEAIPRLNAARQKK